MVPDLNLQKKLIQDLDYKFYYEKYNPDFIISILVDPITNIIKGFLNTEFPPVNYEEPNGGELVILGKVDRDIYNTIIMCIDSAVDSFPVYNKETGKIGLVHIDVKAMNSTYDELTDVYTTTEDVYTFFVTVSDDSGLNTNLENIYIKQMEKNKEIVLINNKHAIKVPLKNKNKFTIKNLKGSKQSFKIKCNLKGETDIWLAKYITIS